MDTWQWVIVGGAALLLLAAAIVWWKRRPRRAITVDHIRVELHPAHIVDDSVVEVVWRAAISMTNTSRRPRALPTVAERATVRAGRRTYLATIYLDADAAEISPGEVTLAWVEWLLPAGKQPGNCQVHELRTLRRPRVWQLVCAVADTEVGECRPATQAPPGATR